MRAVYGLDLGLAVLPGAVWSHVPTLYNSVGVHVCTSWEAVVPRWWFRPYKTIPKCGLAIMFDPNP